MPGDTTVGLAFTALFKCEDEQCGALWIQCVEYVFTTPQAPVQIKCPHGHTKIKFIQTVERNSLVEPPPPARGPR